MLSVVEYRDQQHMLLGNFSEKSDSQRAKSDWEYPIENTAVIWIISDWLCHKSHLGIKGETSFQWNEWLETAISYSKRV